MKILIVLDDFPPVSYSGASIVAHSLAKGFLKRGNEVFVIASVQDKSLEGGEEYEGLKIFRIYSKYHPRWRFYLSLYNPQVVSKFREIIIKIKPDVVHFHHIHHYISYYCFKIAKKNSRAIFLTAHDMLLAHYGKVMPINGNCFYKISIWQQIKEARKRYNPFRNIIIKHYLKYIDKIFSVSNSIKKALEINGVKNIETIHNAIDVNEWREKKENIDKFRKDFNLQNKKIVFFGARLSKAKGGEVILKSMALAIKEINNTILLVVGEKERYTQEMIKLIEKLGIDKNVKFTGWLKREEIKNALFSSDVCMTPSIYLDAFNLFNIEAAAAKKPVVGTCFGGTPEILVDNKTGHIVNPLDINKMADKIIDLLKNPQKAKSFGETGYQRVKDKFSLDRQVENTLKWYKKFNNFGD